MEIRGFQGVSLIDYPGKICSVVFTGGCNMRCPFCQNPELVQNLSPLMEEDKILKAIFERKGFIEGVTITGGEPTIQDSLLDFCKILKNEGFFVKVDTNGYLPDVLKSLLQSIDYISLDIKSSFRNYNNACGIEVDTNRIKESLEILRNLDISYEIRATCVPCIVDDEEIKEIASYIPWAKRFILQQYRNLKVLNADFEKIPPYPSEKLFEFKSYLEGFIPNVLIKGI